MAFTVEVTFTGLGVAVLHGRSGSSLVTGVDLLLINTAMNMTGSSSGQQPMPAANMAGMPAPPAVSVLPPMQHLPRLSFQMEDLASTGEAVFPTPHAADDGSPLVELDLTGMDFQISLNASRKSVTPAQQMCAARMCMESVDLVPDLVNDLGISDGSTASPGTAGSPYIARVQLPAGEVFSRGIFTSPDGSLCPFTYGNVEAERLLAEQFVWVATDIDLATIGFGKGIGLDDQLRNHRGQVRTVQLAVTNLPLNLPAPSRYNPPAHFPMFQAVSPSNQVPNVVKPVPGAAACGGVACPPALLEIV